MLTIVPSVRIALRDNIKYLQGDKYAGYSPDWKNYFEVIEWIKWNTPKDKVIMARKPEFIYLLSRHKSLNWPFTTDYSVIRDEIKRSDYVVLDNFSWTPLSKRLLEPVLQKEIRNIQFVYRTSEPRFYLIKVLK